MSTLAQLPAGAPALERALACSAAIAREAEHAGLLGGPLCDLCRELTSSLRVVEDAERMLTGAAEDLAEIERMCGEASARALGLGRD